MSRERIFWYGTFTGLFSGFVLYNPSVAILKLIEHSSWPISLVLICILFHKPISDLLRKLKRYKDQHREMHFDDASPEDIREFAEVISETPDTLMDPDPENTIQADKLIAKIDPSAAIMSFWSRVYRTLLTETKRLGFQHGDKPTSTNQMLTWLDKHDFLEPDYQGALIRLFRKRNEAAHGNIEQRDSISPFEAEQFAHTCRELIGILEKMQTPDEFPGSKAPDLIRRNKE